MAITYTTNNTTLPTSTITVSSTGSGYTLNTGAGGNGTWLTGATTAATTYNWSNPNTSFTNSAGDALMSIPHGSNEVRIEKQATLEVQGNIVMNGMDLDERLKTIEKVLCIPQRDVTMETKHPKLKQLYDEDMHELEKYKTWERVKGTDND